MSKKTKQQKKNTAQSNALSPAQLLNCLMLRDRLLKKQGEITLYWWNYWKQVWAVLQSQICFATG
uniref:Uncharacterized protein n=1 Tax=Anguilla anguilla TaxID=7936 RepID=A0A0E9XGK0_ANGAN